MTKEPKCENCKHYDTQEKCCLCRNKYWYEPNDEIKIEELEEGLGQAKEIIKEFMRITEMVEGFEPDYSELIVKAEALLNY